MRLNGQINKEGNKKHEILKKSVKPGDSRAGGDRRRCLLMFTRQWWWDNKR